MTQTVSTSDRRSLRIAGAIGGLALLGALVAAAAGVVLLVAAPDAGSSMESRLGFTAAGAGISTAVFAVAALIYAQVKNLWRFAPSWLRTGAWALLIASAVYSIVRSIAQS